MIFLATACLYFGAITNTLAHNHRAPFNHDCTVSNNKSTCTSLHQESSLWSSLTNIAVEVYRVQNKLSEQTFEYSNSFVLVLLNDRSVWKPALSFFNTISVLRPETQLLHFQFENNSFFQDIGRIMEDLMIDEVYIRSFVIFSSDVLEITTLLDTVAMSRSLKWTSIIHITEWIVVSPCPDLQTKIQVREYPIDFMTLIYPYIDNVTLVVQKSRKSGLVIKAKILTLKHLDSKEEIMNKSAFSFAEQKFKFINCTRKIRPHPLLYLKRQRSIMASLHLSVVLPSDAYTRTAYRKQVGNDTIFCGFSVAVFNIMAKVLGFELEFVYVTDGGDYGEVLENGTVTGMTGKLARRESALAAHVSRLENRQKVIDFLPTTFHVESAAIVYRLPKARDTLDKTYIIIFKTDFLLSLIGPLILFAVIASVVHVLTHSCTVPTPQVASVGDIRKLYSCSENICFRHRKDYHGQTARILRASWSVFCFILVSAYSAYLVTTFAVKPEELTIRNFQELLAQNNFVFGTRGSSNALPIVLRTSSDKSQGDTWKRLEQLNKTNPLTFSRDLGYHVKRVMQGQYAFLDHFSVGSGEFYDYVTADEADVRAYPLNDLQSVITSYIAIPKHVFFKEALYKFHLTLEKSGLILKLQDLYFSRKNKPNVSKANSDTIAVDFHRIELLIYVSLAGIGLSSLCLGAEFALRWCKVYTVDRC